MKSAIPVPLAIGVHEIRYTVNPHLRIVYISDDEVKVKHSARSPTSRSIRDDGGTKILGTILRSMVTAKSANELVQAGVVGESKRADLLELISYLESEKVLIRHGEDIVEVYMRSVLGGVQPLRDVKVGVVGNGHLGSRIAEQLVRLGVRKLELMDDRCVTSAGVDSRYFSLPIELLAQGSRYAENLATHLRKLGATEVGVSLEASGNKEALRRVCAAADCVVFASEHPGAVAFHAMNEVALDLGKSWLAVTLDGSEATIGPMFIPGQSACYNEYEIQAEASCWGVKDEFLTYREAMSRGDLGSEHLSLPSYSDIAAGLAATALLRYLIGGKAFLMGRSIRYDFERLSVDTEEVLRLPRCPACAPYRPYRHSYL
jgi:bacteriocin biosynthesis cyclodehydratase domain-containing protein